MKVIKKQDVSAWNYKHTCTNCDSELEVDAKDLIHHHYDGDQREPAYDSFTAICAVCSNSFTIFNDKIPKIIQVETKNRTARLSTGSYWDR